MIRGTACLARLGPAWVDARILLAHPGGTFSVVEVGQESSLFGDWHSVPAADLSEDDEARWARLAAPHADPEGRLGPDEVAVLLGAVGSATTGEALAGWWEEVSGQLFGDAPPRRPIAEVYRMIRGAGWCGKAFDPSVPRPTWSPLWWNQVRMGGRDPGEVEGPVGVDAALAALGLEGAPEDPAVVAAMDALEAREGFRLPAELRALASRRGFADAFRDAHCNNPEWSPVDAWEVVREPRCELPGGLGLVVALPHQGDHQWMVVFADRADTAAVATRHPTDDGPVDVPTAPTLAFFLCDLAQANADWARGIAAPKLDATDA